MSKLLSLPKLEFGVHFFPISFLKDNTSKIVDLYTKKCNEFIYAVDKYWESLSKLDKNIDWSNLSNLLKEKYIDDIKGFIDFFSQKSKLFKIYCDRKLGRFTK